MRHLDEICWDQIRLKQSLIISTNKGVDYVGRVFAHGDESVFLVLENGNHVRIMREDAVVIVHIKEIEESL